MLLTYLFFLNTMLKIKQNDEKIIPTAAKIPNTIVIGWKMLLTRMPSCGMPSVHVMKTNFFYVHHEHHVSGK